MNLVSRRSSLILLLLISALNAWNGLNLHAAENTLFPGWEAEIRLAPGILLSRAESFELKPQFGLRAEAQAGFKLFRYDKTALKLRFIAGIQWVGASSLDGAYAYNGYRSTYMGLLLSMEQDIREFLRWRVHTGLLGEWAVYTNTQNLVFFPTARIEPGLGLSLSSFTGKPEGLVFYAALPAEWSFRRDTEISLGLAVTLGATVEWGGVK